MRHDEKTNSRDAIAGLLYREEWSDFVAGDKLTEVKMILLKQLPAHLLHLAARWMRLEFQVNIRLDHFLRERNYGVSDFLTDRAPITFITP